MRAGRCLYDKVARLIVRYIPKQAAKRRNSSFSSDLMRYCRAGNLLRYLLRVGWLTSYMIGVSICRPKVSAGTRLPAGLRTNQLDFRFFSALRAWFCSSLATEPPSLGSLGAPGAPGPAGAFIDALACACAAETTETPMLAPLPQQPSAC